MNMLENGFRSSLDLIATEISGFPEKFEGIDNHKLSEDFEKKQDMRREIEGFPESFEAKETTVKETGEQEAPGKRGGSYGELKKMGYGEFSEPPQEVHHMPADSVSFLERSDGPAITMDKEDHRETASCGLSRDAMEYRAEQKKLIDEGKFKEAVQMDIDDLYEKFGNKYDDAIADMLKYVGSLEKEGIING